MPETQYIKPKERGGLGYEYEVFDPKVIVKNNVFPLPHEYHNCSTCRRASLTTKQPRGIQSWCGFTMKWKMEREDLIDNGCPAHARKIPRADI
jgi:hypothetical protein